MRSGRKGIAQVIITIVVLLAILTGVLLALSIVRLKLKIHTMEVVQKEDQLPALQASSYSTIARVRRTPISFYELSGVSALTEQTTFTVFGKPKTMPVLFNSTLEAYMEELAKLYPNCFEYNLNNYEREDFVKSFLAAGTSSKASCLNYAKSAAKAGLENYGRKNYIYFVPMPPGEDRMARLTEMFTRVFSFQDALPSSASQGPIERPKCKAIGETAGAAEECCSGMLSVDGICGYIEPVEGGPAANPLPSDIEERQGVV